MAILHRCSPIYGLNCWNHNNKAVWCCRRWANAPDADMVVFFICLLNYLWLIPQKADNFIDNRRQLWILAWWWGAQWRQAVDHFRWRWRSVLHLMRNGVSVWNWSYFWGVILPEPRFWEAIWGRRPCQTQEPAPWWWGSFLQLSSKSWKWSFLILIIFLNYPMHKW